MMKLTGNALAKIDRNDPRYLALRAKHLRLVQKDPTIWGMQAAVGATERLNWIDLPESSRDLLPVLDALSAKHRDKSRFVLCGMGGSSLGPDVIAQSYKKKLFVLDSTDPNYIAHALDGDLATILVIVSSKSGSTVETTSQRALFESAFTAVGLRPQDHIIIITDPDSALDKQAREREYTVVNADPNVGGRFSALTAFGLVPAALLGVDVSVLLDSASETKSQFVKDSTIVVDMAYAIAYLAGQYISMSDAGSTMPGLSDWAEQLIAESTGKEGTGRLPVVTESPSENFFSIAFSGNADLVIESDLASQFIIWEWVTALVCAALEIDPFNQPNVAEAKAATTALLADWDGVLPPLIPESVDANIEIFGAGATLTDALHSFISSIPSDGYVAVMAYLDRRDDAKVKQLGVLLSQKTSRPVTFGWGPRFLHSTGQFHKGGQHNGAFLQITGDVKRDIAIPGQSFGFKTLLAAQFLGDAKALASRNYPLLRLNLTNRSVGIDQLLSALTKI